MTHNNDIHDQDYFESLLEETHQINFKKMPLIHLGFLLCFILGILTTSFGYKNVLLTSISVLLFIFNFALTYMIAFFPENPLISKLSKNEKTNKTIIFFLLITILIWIGNVSWCLITERTSWGSFYFLLFNFGILSAFLPLLLPNKKLVQIIILSMTLPLLILFLFFIGGSQGVALSIFVAMFLIALLVITQNIYDNYMNNLHTNAQLFAMIDAMPGTLSWVGSDLKYRGVNLKLASIWNLKPKDFIGQKLGFVDPSSPLVNFMQQLFDDPNKKGSSHLVLNMAGQVRKYFVVGQKFNHGQEAVIIGLDLTDQDKK